MQPLLRDQRCQLRLTCLKQNYVRPAVGTIAQVSDTSKADNVLIFEYGTLDFEAGSGLSWPLEQH
jgi:hypothetical protein